MNINNIKILDLEGEKKSTILSPLDNISISENFENKINLLTFRKKDSYVNIGTESEWYALDYFELNLMPLKLVVSKAQLSFIIDFFFKSGNDTYKPNYEEEYKLLMKSSKFNEKKTNEKKEPKQKTKVEKTKQKVEHFPIYFKQFKINDTQIELTFIFGEGSHLVNIAFNLRI